MKETTTKILEKLLKTINSTEDFLLEQTPQLLQELILFAQYKHGLLFIGSILTFVMALFLLIAPWTPKLTDENEVWLAPARFIGTISGISFFLIGGCASIRHLTIYLKAWVAPRVYILDYLRDGLGN